MALRPLRRSRTTGEPRSSNGASSFHLRWGALPPRVVEVSALCEIVEPPTVDRLYFWALQAGFGGGGAAHIGLQWYSAHPGNTAVNWGGYDASGRVLDGSTSSLPSATGNPNTRDFTWEPGRPYRFRISRAGDGWRGEVDGVHVRDLFAPGPYLTAPVVWSEVFARCEHPSVVVRWSGFTAVTADGDEAHPDRVAVSYQRRADGGCDNTTVRLDGDGILQITNATRDVRAGAVLPLPSPT